MSDRGRPLGAPRDPRTDPLMEPTSIYRPRVSRETRLLLTAGLLAITVLWLLARVRFRDRPAPSPIPAVLGQLTARPKLDDLAAEVGELRTRLAPSLVAIDWPSDGLETPRRVRRIAGLRHRDGTAVAHLSSRALFDTPGVVAVDPASGLAVLRAPGRAPSRPTPSTTAPTSPRTSRSSSASPSPTPRASPASTASCRSRWHSRSSSC